MGKSETTPLVFIYCDYVTSRAPVVEDTNNSWAELIRHLENRAPFSKGNEIAENPKFQECVNKNAVLFETGEFILDGKHQVESLLHDLQKTPSAKPELLSVSFSFEDRSLSTPEFQIYLEDEPTDVSESNERIANDLHLRRARYESEWQDWTNALQSEASSSINRISLKKD